MGHKRRYEAFDTNTPEGCTAKAESIRRVAAALSDTTTIERALRLAESWDDRAEALRGKQRRPPDGTIPTLAAIRSAAEQ